MTALAPSPITAPQAQLRAIFDDSLRWFQLHGGELLVALVAGVLIYFALRIVRRWIRGRALAQVDASGVGATILRTLARTRHFFLIAAAARLVIGYANPPQVISQTIGFLFIVAFAMQAAIWAKEVVMSLVRQRASDGQSETLANAQSLINVLVSIALFAIAAIVVLDNVGVNVTGLIAGLGIGGIAIGLAAKGVFEDLFAALAIIFDRPFRRGDAIRFESTNATVERIGLKSTRLRALTGEEVVISNTHLLSKQISNFARLERRRMNFVLSVVGQTPPAKLRAIPSIVAEVVAAHDSQLVRCGMTGFGASSIDFDAQFDVHSEDYETVFAARHAIGIALVERFAAEGISFAYPTQVSYTAAPDGTFVMPYDSSADRST